MYSNVKDLTKKYDGFLVTNLKTGKSVKYRYRQGVYHVDVETSAIKEQQVLQEIDRGSLMITGFIAKNKFWE